MIFFVFIRGSVWDVGDFGVTGDVTEIVVGGLEALGVFRRIFLLGMRR